MNAVPMIGKMRYLPVREMIWPLTIEEIMSPRIIGNSWKPLSVGVDPFTIWRYRGTVDSAPNIPNPTSTPSTVAMEKVRLRNSFNGISASSPMPRSMRMNDRIPRPPTT